MCDLILKDLPAEVADKFTTLVEKIAHQQLWAPGMDDVYGYIRKFEKSGARVTEDEATEALHLAAK